MTKKSIGRMQRDAAAGKQNELRKAFEDGELKDNRLWDDLKNTYQQNTQLIGTATMVGEILNNRELLSFVQEPKALSEQVRILTKDLRQLLDELKKIYAAHSSFSGYADVDHIMQCYQLFETYGVWATQYQALVEPTMAQIVEITHVAEMAMMAARAEATMDQSAEAGEVIEGEATEVATVSEGGAE